MTFCVCAMSLSTVSCGKLEDEINTLKGQVEGINQKLAALESKLNADVASLNAAIAAVEAKVAVVKVEEKDGMVVLTLANGNQINVGKPDANANNTGLVTTVTKDGKTYWAVVNADGTVQNLNVEVGHPDVKLSFKVDAETRALLISYDGTNYESTGVVVKDPDAYKHIVTNFAEGEDYVTFTIGEKQYKLPKYEDAGSVLLGRTEMFVLPGVTKEITLDAEGVTECYVMSKPDGWKAVLNDGVLTVSAPSQAVVDFGACETEGQVLVHATTAGGKCVVAPLNVKTGPAITFSLDSEGNMTIFNALAYTGTNNWGQEFTDFAYVGFGICTVEEYIAFENSTVFFENAASEYWGYGLTNLLNNVDNDLNPWYEEGYNEEYTSTVNINDLARYFDPPMTLDPEKTYVVWILPRDGKNDPVYEYADLAFTKPYATNEVSNETYNNVDIELYLNGADAFYVGAVSQKFLTENWYTSVEEYLVGSDWMPGAWSKFTSGNPAALGTKLANGAHNIKLSDIVDEVSPNSEYFVWAVPYIENKTDYDFETDFTPYMFTAATEPRTFNANLVATITDILNDPYEVGATITPPAGASVYSYIFSEESYEYAVESDQVMYYLESETPTTNPRVAVEDYDVNPGSKFYLVTYVVKDGEEGPVQVKELVASDLTYATDINVEFVSLTEDAEAATYTVTFNVTGGANFAGYNISYPGSEWSPSLPSFEKNVYTQYGYYLNYVYNVAEVAEDGVVTVTFAKNANKTHYLATAYNTNDDDEMTGMAKTVVVNLATGTVVDTTATEEEEELQ